MYLTPFSMISIYSAICSVTSLLVACSMVSIGVELFVKTVVLLAEVIGANDCDMIRNAAAVVLMPAI
jgi:hypothetical protein